MSWRMRVVAGVVLVGAIGAAGSLAAGGLAGAAGATAVVSARDVVKPSYFDEATAVEVARDEYTVTETDAAGVNRATVSVTPLSVWRDGAWVAASPELTESPEGDFVAPNHPMEPVVGATADAESLVAASRDGVRVQVELEGAAGVSGVLEAAEFAPEGVQQVRYPAAVAGDDLIVTVAQTGVHQRIVLDAAPAHEATYSWVVRVDGGTLEPGVDGGLDVIDPAGAVAMVIPGPVMWDSLSPEGGVADSASLPLDYQLTVVSDGVWRISATLDLTWLRDPARQFPVYVDPDIYPGGTVHTYKENNWTYNYGTEVRVGNSKESSTCCAWRTVMQYPLNGYFGKRVIGSPAVVANWTYGTTTTQYSTMYWANAFSFAGNGDMITGFNISTSGYAQDDAVFKMVAHYLNNSDPYSYVMLTGQEANNIYGRKDLTTYLSFVYVDPAVVKEVTGATPKTLSGAPLTQRFVDDIVMQATGTNNTPGTQQLFNYKFTSTNGGVAWESGFQPSGPFRLPATALTPGKDYTYTIDTMDTGTASPVKTATNATEWRFHTSSAPLTPSNVTVGGQALTQPVVVTSAYPEIAATVGDADGSAGGAVWAVFTVKRDGIVVVDSLAGSPADASGVSKATLPYAVTAGSTYTVEVRAFDGHLASDPINPSGTFTGPAGGFVEIPGNDDSFGANS